MTQPPDPNAGGHSWQPHSSPEGHSPHVSDGSTQNFPASVPTPPPTGFNSVEHQLAPGAEQSPIDPFATSPPDYDDSSGKRTGRDRLLFTVLWEGVLLAAVIGLVSWLHLGTNSEMTGNARGFSLTVLIDNLGPAVMLLALIGVAFGLTARMGAPNFGVVTAPILGGAWIITFSIDNVFQHLAIVLAIAAIPTLVMVVLSVYLRLSPWLSGFVAALAVYAFVLTYNRRREGEVSSAEESFADPGYNPSLDLATWQIFAIVVVLCVGAGLLGALPAMRDRFSKVAAMLNGDEPRSASLVTFLAAGTFLAGLLGIAAVHGLELLGAADVMSAPIWGNVLFYEFFNLGSVIAFAVLALLVAGVGGTSMRGRRGGIAGVVLSASVVYLFMELWESTFSELDDGQAVWEEFATDTWVAVVAFVMVVVAMVVSAVADMLGRPKVVAEPEGDAVVTLPFGPHQGADGNSDADLGLFSGNQDEDSNMFGRSKQPPSY